MHRARERGGMKNIRQITENKETEGRRQKRKKESVSLRGNSAETGLTGQ